MSVSYHRDETTAVITMDDGKVNVLGPQMLGAINDALDRAETESAGAVVIAGNERVFSAGFDLKVFRSGDIQASIDMLRAGFELSHRLLSFPTPVSAAASMAPTMTMAEMALVTAMSGVCSAGVTVQTTW